MGIIRRTRVVKMSFHPIQILRPYGTRYVWVRCLVQINPTSHQQAMVELGVSNTELQGNGILRSILVPVTHDTPWSVYRMERHGTAVICCGATATTRAQYMDTRRSQHTAAIMRMGASPTFRVILQLMDSETTLL